MRFLNNKIILAVIFVLVIAGFGLTAKNPLSAQTGGECTANYDSRRDRYLLGSNNCKSGFEPKIDQGSGDCFCVPITPPPPSTSRCTLDNECTTPPPLTPYCSNNVTLITGYETQGSCFSGSCQYGLRSQICQYGCSNGRCNPPPPSPARLEISPSTLILTVGQNGSLSAFFYPAGSNTPTNVSSAASWFSDSPGVVSVGKTGVFEARNPGDARITASYQNFSQSIFVIVRPASQITPTANVSISVSSPEPGKVTLSWSSSGFNSCVGTGGDDSWPGSKSLNSAPITYSVAGGSYNYSLTCSKTDEKIEYGRCEAPGDTIQFECTAISPNCNARCLEGYTEISSVSGSCGGATYKREAFCRRTVSQTASASVTVQAPATIPYKVTCSGPTSVAYNSPAIYSVVTSGSEIVTDSYGTWRYYYRWNDSSLADCPSDNDWSGSSSCSTIPLKSVSSSVGINLSGQIFKRVISSSNPANIGKTEPVGGFNCAPASVILNKTLTCSANANPSAGSPGQALTTTIIATATGNVAAAGDLASGSIECDGGNKSGENFNAVNKTVSATCSYNPPTDVQSRNFTPSAVFSGAGISGSCVTQATTYQVNAVRRPELSEVKIHDCVNNKSGVTLKLINYTNYTEGNLIGREEKEESSFFLRRKIATSSGVWLFDVTNLDCGATYEFYAEFSQ